jgi:hypothetical protein
METDDILVAMAEKAEYLKVHVYLECEAYHHELSAYYVFCVALAALYQDIDLALGIYELLPYPASEREAALLIAR